MQKIHAQLILSVKTLWALSPVNVSKDSNMLITHALVCFVWLFTSLFPATYQFEYRKVQNNASNILLIVSCLFSFAIDIDVDECLEKKHSCPANSKCVNTASSYSCKCLPGYKILNGKLCVGKEYI